MAVLFVHLCLYHVAAAVHDVAAAAAHDVAVAAARDVVVVVAAAHDVAVLVLGDVAAVVRVAVSAHDAAAFVRALVLRLHDAPACSTSPPSRDPVRFHVDPLLRHAIYQNKKKNTITFHAKIDWPCRTIPL